MPRLRLPITVHLGPSCRRDLYTTDDILDFLEEWPPARRGPIREKVRRTCLAAYAGEATTEEVRKAFVAYARLMGVIEPSRDASTTNDGKRSRGTSPV